MKRTAEDKFILFFNNFISQVSKVKTVIPFSWTKCCKCNNEFKYESMLCSSYPSYLGLMKIENYYLYGCKKCFKDKAEFINYLFTDSSSKVKQEYSELMKECEKTLGKDGIDNVVDILKLNNNKLNL